MIPVMLAIVAIYVTSNIYIARSIWRWLGFSAKWAGRVWGVGFALLASLFVITSLWQNLPRPISRPLNMLGGWYLGAAYIFLLILVPLCALVTRGKGGPMAAFVALAVALIMTVYGAFAAYNIKIKEYKVESGGREMTAVLLSDLHFGEIIGASDAAKMVERVNALEPDFVFIAGDIFDSGVDGLYDKEGVGEAMRGLKATMGVYACLGNHDGGFVGKEGEAAALMESWGITVLRDEAVSLDGVTIIGRKDRSSPRLSAARLTENVDPNSYVIMLDHQPYEFEEEKAAGADLILCGHTHRGQIFPGNLITRAVYRLDYGMETEDDCTMIVSCGVGTWGPRLRIGSNSEIVKINIG